MEDISSLRNLIHGKIQGYFSFAPPLSSRDDSKKTDFHFSFTISKF